MLSHSTTQFHFFVIIYTPINSDFKSECNKSIFTGNGQELTKIFCNYLTQLKKTEHVPIPQVTPQPVLGVGVWHDFGYTDPYSMDPTCNPWQVSKPVIFPRYHTSWPWCGWIQKVVYRQLEEVPRATRPKMAPLYPKSTKHISHLI